MIVKLIDPITGEAAYYDSVKHHRWSDGTYARSFRFDLLDTLAAAHARHGSLENWEEMRDYELWCNMFMFRQKDEPIHGAVFDPIRDELYCRAVDLKEEIYKNIYERIKRDKETFEKGRADESPVEGETP